MRKIRKILIGFVLSLFLCVSSLAQNKIAVVDRDAFYDEKSGITELVVAIKKLEAEFKSEIDEVRVLNEKLDKLVTHLQNQGWVNYPNKSHLVEGAASEVQELQKNIKLIVDGVNPRLAKRKAEIVEPINKRIAEKLKNFAKKNGYAILLDKGKMNDGIILINPEPDDITNEFITFCNQEFEKENAQIK